MNNNIYKVVVFCVYPVEKLMLTKTIINVCKHFNVHDVDYYLKPTYKSNKIAR